jgi:hypothetical protein
LIVYVESNFVLEIARVQEQAKDAEGLLLLAEEGRVNLVLPSIAATEPFSTWGYRRTDFQRARPQLEGVVRSLLPAGVDLTIVLDADYVERVLADTLDRLTHTVLRILRVGAALPLDFEVFRRSTEYRRLGLSKPQDALVFASIIHDLASRDATEPKCFVSKDGKDFDQEDLKQQLQEFGCVLKPNFVAGLQWVRAQLQE